MLASRVEVEATEFAVMTGTAAVHGDRRQYELLRERGLRRFPRAYVDALVDMLTDYERICLGSGDDPDEAKEQGRQAWRLRCQWMASQREM